VKVYSCVLSHEYSDNMTKLRTFAAVVGCILSAYAVYVEYKVASIHAHKATTIVPADETTEAPFLKEVEEEPEFVALCDIKSIGASCSNVFTLPEGRMLSYFGIVPAHSVLDLPNAALGFIHYTYLLTLRPLMPKSITYFMILMAFASTVFLAYQLTFVLFELCILCWTTHVINTYNFYSYFFSGKASNATKKKSE
jgi:uncharacterized membrane protein